MSDDFFSMCEKGETMKTLEGQKRPVSDIELNALADVLGVSVNWLLGREE